MEAERISLVQNSFRLIKDPVSLTSSFYNNLFELDPTLRSLFKGDMQTQSKMLASALEFAINGLSNLDSIKPTLAELGLRHKNYGVTNQHYSIVGAALLKTLQMELTDSFTDDVKKSWECIYNVLVDTMVA